MTNKTIFIRVGGLVLAVTALVFAVLIDNPRIGHAQSFPQGFGSQIVCFVFSDLNMFGSPIPYLDARDCPSTPPPSTGSLKVRKFVVGGTTPPSDFQIHVKSGGSDISGSPQPGSMLGTSYIGLIPGSYAVSETGTTTADYTVSFGGACDSSGIVAVASSSIPAVCTVTNTFHAPPLGAEDTLTLCSDGIDNNGNGLVDLADPSCSAFIPKLTVTKVVSGGAAHVSDFSLFLDGHGITSGVATTTSVGSHIVNETASSTYPGTWSGACDSAGHVSLAIGDSKSCTLTNTFTSTPPATTQCNDGIDNDGDGLIDSADPGCHTDFNALNPSSYDPTLNNEAAAPQEADVCPNIAGVQTEIPSGKVLQGGNCVDASSGGAAATVSTGGGGGNGPIAGSYGFVVGGQVLGASTTAFSNAQVLSPGNACGTLITTYMRITKKNDAADVKRLQTFLNNHMNAGLPVTGFFGPQTDAAVRKFQLQYSEQVLAPWVVHGLANSQTSTGYVYKTTRRWINLIACKDLNLPMPQLP